MNTTKLARGWRLWLSLPLLVTFAVACSQGPVTEERSDLPLELAPSGPSFTELTAAERDELLRLRAEADEERRLLEEQEALLEQREAQLARLEELQRREEKVLERERGLANREEDARLTAQRIARRDAELAENEERIRAAREELAAEEERLAEKRDEVEAATSRVEPEDRSWTGDEEWRGGPSSSPGEVVSEADAEVKRTVELLRAGMEFQVEVQEDLSSRDSRVGDVFRTVLATDVVGEQGQVVVPAGSVVLGTVVEARPLRKVGGQAALGLVLDRLLLSSGEEIEIEATFVELGRNKKRDKRKIAGAVAAGAILGRIFGDGEAAIVGGIIGGAAGTAAVMKAKGRDVEIPAGTVVTVELQEVVTSTARYGPVANSR